MFYVQRLPDIYVSSSSVKVAKSGGNILTSPLMDEMRDIGGDRFIANEIEILKSNDLRERVAQAIIDSIIESSSKEDFNLSYITERNSNKKTLRSDSSNCRNAWRCSGY